MSKVQRGIGTLCICQLREDSGNHSPNTVHSYLAKEKKDVVELPKNTNFHVRNFLEDNCRPTYLFS